MIILDTCVFIWLGIQPDKISKSAKSVIHSNPLAISDITFLEIGYLVKKKKLELSCSGEEFSKLVLQAHDIEVLPLTPEVVETALNFGEEINNDPVDRIICATALAHDAKLVTSDKNILANQVIQTVW
jgi:PIN domain nuclease of toxin-antitoxin system